MRLNCLALLPILMMGLSGPLSANPDSDKIQTLIPLLRQAKESTRLDAVRKLEELVTARDQEFRFKLSLQPELLSNCIVSLAAAIGSETDELLRNDQAHCLLSLLVRSTKAEQDISAVVPLLESRDNSVIYYTWQGVGSLTEQVKLAFPEPLREKLWSYTESPNVQVQINALRWGYAVSELEKAQSVGSLDPFQKRVWEKVLSSGRSSNPRLATAAVRFLLPLVELDFETVLNILSQQLSAPIQDEEQILTLQGICEFAGSHGMEARQLSLPLQAAFKEMSKEQVPGAKTVLIMAMASVGPLPKELHAAITAELKRPQSQDQMDYSMPGLSAALSEAGPSEQESISNMLRNASKIKGWRPRGIFTDVMARTGVSADLAPRCIAWFKATPPEQEQSLPDLLSAVGASRTKDPQVLDFLTKQLKHKQYQVQLSAAYALMKLEVKQTEVTAWVLGGGLAKGSDLRHSGLLLSIVQRLKIRCNPPAGFVADSIQKSTLLHLIDPNRENANWNLAKLLVDSRLSVGWMRCASLEDTQTTLTFLRILADEAPKMTQEPTVLKLLKYSPNTEVVEAADRAYQALWPAQTATPK